MKFSNICVGLLLAVASEAAKSVGPMGWGTGTVGGDGGVEYHVNSFEEFKNALNNNGKPNEAKIIYVDSTVSGTLNEKGEEITAESYVPGFTLESYLNCFTKDGKEYLTTEECAKIEELRLQGVPLQREKITVFIPSKTTVIGSGKNSIIKDIEMEIRGAEQVIFKDLTVQAPIDLFPQWDPTDGIAGSWNSEYDAIEINNSTYVWIDNCLLTDGDHKVNYHKQYFGKYIEEHDGLLDITNSADYVTVSNNRLENHQKSSLIGNSDKLTSDAGHLKVTFYNNVFKNCNERLPRVRFGQVHVFNNYYYASTFDEVYPSLTVANYYHDDSVFPSYFIGLGVESNIRSENNYFVYEGNEKIPAADDIIVYSYGGHIFKDTGSMFNGKEIDLTALAKKSFELKKKTKMADNLLKNKTNPAWTSEEFSENAFVPSEIYDYELNTDMEEIADLVNKVPSWLFEGEDGDESDNDDDKILDNVDDSDDEKDLDGNATEAVEDSNVEDEITGGAELSNDEATPAVDEAKPAVEETKQTEDESEDETTPAVDEVKPAVDETKQTEDESEDETTPAADEVKPAVEETKQTEDESEDETTPVVDEVKPAVEETKQTEDESEDETTPVVDEIKPTEDESEDETTPAVDEVKPAEESVKPQKKARKCIVKKL